MKPIQVFTFILVCSLTIAQNPLQKIADALSTKYQKKAQKEICDLIVEKREVYGGALVAVWTGACISTVRDRALADVKGDEKKIALLEKIFSDKEDPQFIKVHDFCEGRAANWHLQADPDEVITSDLQAHFKCRELYEKESEREKFE